MKLIAPNENGVFTFGTEDSGKEVVFVKGAAIVADRETNHCSVHSFYASGCSDCVNATLVNQFDFSKGAPLPSFRKAHLTHATHPLSIVPSYPSPKLQLVRQQLDTVLRVFFANTKIKVAKAACRKYAQLVKAEMSDEQAIYKAALDEIYWDDIVDNVAADLMEAAAQGIVEGTSQIGATADREAAASVAETYAKSRAANMVGKKIENGVLVDNPSAIWAISDTTRDNLKDIIEEAVVNDIAVSELEQRLMQSYTFSNERAGMIARTEVAMAHVRTNLNIWKTSGYVKTVDIVLSVDHKESDNCDLVAASGPFPINTVPLLPLHPNCLCGYQAREITL